MAKAGTVIVDFTDAEGGGRIRIPEDDYRLKVKEIGQKDSKAGNPMLVWKFVISAGDHKGKELVDRFVLSKEAAWKLKQVVEAMGYTVPSKKVALQYTKYIGKELGATVADGEPYNGKVKSEIMDYISLDVLDTDEEGIDEDEDEVVEEEAPKGKKGKKNKKGKKGKKAKLADDDDEEVEELDLDEI